MNKKKDIRTWAKEVRHNINIKLASEKIVEKIKSLEIYKNAKNIMIFYPLENEINLLNLLEDTNKNFYLPKTINDQMMACPYKKGDDLEKGDFNVLVPLTDEINPQILDLIFTPALVVDKNNYRLGYGKGFYDRFLEKTTAKTIAVIEKELLIDRLPIDTHDKKVDFVITD